MRIICIIASTKAGVIGNEGKLPWYYPSEIRHFKSYVKNQTIIMGRKTFDSLPQSLLDVTSSIIFSHNNKVHYRLHKNSILVNSLEEFMMLFKQKDVTYYLIGGAIILELFILNQLIDEVILTYIKKDYPGDTRINLAFLQSWQREKLWEQKHYSIYRFLRCDLD